MAQVIFSGVKHVVRCYCVGLPIVFSTRYTRCELEVAGACLQQNAIAAFAFAFAFAAVPLLTRYCETHVALCLCSWHSGVRVYKGGLHSRVQMPMLCMVWDRVPQGLGSISWVRVKPAHVVYNLL